MNIDQFIFWKIDQDDRLRDIVNDSATEALMQNIKSMRNLIINFIAISSAIIGFTIPVLGKTDLIKSYTVLLGGLAELLIVVMYGFWHLTWILQKENNNLVILHTKYNDYLDQLRDARNKFFSNMTTETKNQWFQQQEIILKKMTNSATQEHKPDYALDIIFAAFSVALALIILSLVDFSNHIKF